ncbi:DUF3221 domain-containing protein [Metabacillus niabensis]|uniref:DUF3221 domain-containing protein n=1 Tax=Metabacillus niabensis TaxID=324854 RepID=A0ABT9YWC3_9BACI|nr:DUF3221 domain-containing protein [Metabacillus niabensis]MDQ0223897.1 hypothetical protein [Metabacillus niabensis]
MKYIIVITIVMLLLLGCKANNTSEMISELEKPNDNRTMSGVVYSGIEGKWLLLNVKSPPDLSNYDLEQVKKEFKDIIQLYNLNSRVQSGDKITIWYDYIRESYPPKTKVLKYEKIVDK